MNNTIFNIYPWLFYPLPESIKGIHAGEVRENRIYSN